MGKSTNYYEAIQRQSSVYGCQSWSMRTDENTEKKVENENSKGWALLLSVLYTAQERQKVSWGTQQFHRLVNCYVAIIIY